MKLHFNKEARKSVAGELKKASWGVAAISSYFGVTHDSLLALAVTVAAWLVLQVIAHIILSMDES